MAEQAKATGGSVLYGRTVKTGDYENKKAEVRLDFSFGDTDDQAGFLQGIIEQATFKTHEILFTISAGAASRAAVQAKAAENTAQSEVAPAGARGRAGRPPASRADTVGGVVDPATLKADSASAAEVVEELPGEDNASAPTSHGPAGSGTPADVLASTDAAAAVDESLFAADAAEITDVELTGAVTRKNAEIANPPVIRALIGSFFREPQGKQVKDIPQAQRRAFLDKLAGLAVMKKP